MSSIEHESDIAVAEKIEIKEPSQYDVIVHLAAISGIGDCKNDINGSIRDNVIAPLNLFRLAREQEIPVIFSSSQAAKTPEANLYAMQKKIAEVEAKRLNEIGADIKVLRFTNVYGGINFLKNKTTVVKQFIEAVKKGEEFVVNGNGEQIRDFIHVDDVCRAIYKCLEYDGQIINPIDIGTGIGTSVFELAKMTKGKFTFDEYSTEIGTMKNVADTKGMKIFFKFEAEKKIEDYIKEQIK